MVGNEHRQHLKEVGCDAEERVGRTEDQQPLSIDEEQAPYTSRWAQRGNTVLIQKYYRWKKKKDLRNI